MDRNSSDEDDDRETLVHPNDNKHNLHNDDEHNRRSIFHIDDFQSRIRRRFSFDLKKLNKRYLFLIFLLPVFIVLLYFSVNLRDLFPTNIGNFKFDSLADRMRESELRALSLLKQQRLQLVTLWNQSFFNNNHTNPSLQDAKFALLNQIALSKEIEQVLLSPHKVSNFSHNSEVWNPSNGVDSFRKVDSIVPGRKTIEWKPKSDKFLFVICLSGKMSNHLICLEKHMFFATLLGRLLVIPSSTFDYQYSSVLDIEHRNECLGRKVVVSFEEFMETKKSLAHIDRFLCYFSAPQPCYIDDEHVKKLKRLGLSMGKIETVWNEDTRKPSKKSVQDVEGKFKVDDDVIAIGDVFLC